MSVLADPGFDVTLRLPVRTARRLLGVVVVRLGQSALANAIAQAEGANVSGSIPNKANNPGDLELGDIGYGTIAAAGGQQITVFPSLSAGLAALENQISLIASGQSKAGYPQGATIAQVGAIYAGDTSGTWAQNVANALGLSPDTSFAAAAGLEGGSPAEAPSGAENAIAVDLDTEASGLGLSSAALLGLAAAAVLTLYVLA